MRNLENTLKRHLVAYVTRDIERVMGLDLDTPGYFIISNFTDFARGLAKGRKNILLIKETRQLDTWELLQLLVHPERSEGSFKGYIGGKKIDFSTYKNQWFERFLPRRKGRGRNARILVFKNTSQIEKICAENGWRLLNPSAELSNKVEAKISQLDWLGPLKKYLPEYKVQKCRKIKFSGKKFILQFNRSHTGSGTVLIESKRQLDDIKKRFPEREARTAKYIEGPLFTNNNVVANAGILIGNISYQITGLKPFTDLPFATIGNDWALPHKILSKKQIAAYEKIAIAVGRKLKKDGWKGLFGIDVVVDEKTGKLYLLEINCRQPASAAYESELQKNKKTKKQKNKLVPSKAEGKIRTQKSITIFEAHLASLLDIDLRGYNLIEIVDGAQILSRITYHVSRISENQIKKLRDAGFKAICYNNTKFNSDLLRIQSPKGIMERHNKFNEIGNQIIVALKNF